MYDANVKDFGVLVVVTVLVDECGYAAVRESCDRIAVSYSEKPYDVQVLVRGGAPSEPSVICDVHHEARTCIHGFANEVSEDGVVADVWRPFVRPIDGCFFSRDKVAFAKINVVEDGEYVVEGNALAKGNEVFLDVTLRKALSISSVSLTACS